MKKMLRPLLYWYLAALARFVLARERPYIIAVTGTVNKYFVREAIAQKLTEKGINVETASNGFNTEIGLSLAVLGLSSGFESYSRWKTIVFKALQAAFRKKLQKVLIVELGVSRPGDMKQLLRIIKPRAVVISDLTQRYRENFSDLTLMAHEYDLLIKALPRQGLIVLNYDTITVRELGANVSAALYYFSLNSSEPKQAWSASAITRTSSGEKFTLHSSLGVRTLEIARFGRHHVAATLIAEIFSHNLIVD